MTDKTYCQWEEDTGEALLPKYNHSGEVLAYKVSPDNKPQLIVAVDDNYGSDYLRGIVIVEGDGVMRGVEVRTTSYGNPYTTGFFDNRDIGREYARWRDRENNWIIEDTFEEYWDYFQEAARDRDRLKEEAKLAKMAEDDARREESRKGHVEFPIIGKLGWP